MLLCMQAPVPASKADMLVSGPAQPLKPMAASAVSRNEFLALLFNLTGPFLHHVFVREADDEVVDARVALPEDLTRI